MNNNKKKRKKKMWKRWANASKQLYVKNASSSNNSVSYCAVTLIQLVTSCGRERAQCLHCRLIIIAWTQQQAAGGRKRRRHNSATNYYIYCGSVYNVTLWIFTFLMNSSLIGSTGIVGRNSLFLFIEVCRWFCFRL